MEHRVTARRVWDDIEFELMQGLPSQDDLGRSIRAAQQQQDVLRTQVFGKDGRLGDQREIVARQFQMNEMLLTLLQETATSLRKVQLDVERISRIPHPDPSPARPAAVPLSVAAAGAGGGRTIEQTLKSVTDPVDSAGSPAESSRPLTDLEQGMRPDALALSMPREGQATQPLVGGLILRIKRAFHRLVLFHVRSLAEKQGGINRTYGEWIRYQVGLGERQGEKLLGLSRRVAAIEARTVRKDNPS